MDAKDINTALDDTKDVVNNADELVKEIEEAKDKVDPISTSTVTSLIIAVVVLVNAILMMLGVDKQLDTNIFYQLGSIIALVANMAYAIWKNHNITVDARKRQKVGDIVIPKK